MKRYQIIRNYIVKFTRDETPKVVEKIQISALGAADACKHFDVLFKGSAEIQRMDIIPEDEPGNRSAFADLSGFGLSEMLGNKRKLPATFRDIWIALDKCTQEEHANVDGRYES